MSTFKSKYNNKYGFSKNESHSVQDISKTTGIKKSILQDVYDRGVGAWKSNPTSVRSKSGDKKDSGFPLSQRMTKERWAYGRVYGFVMKNPKQVGEGKPDSDLYKKL
tara:strand:- start:27 stop:347 length:321 start_codon:yes stop_codon:yes gene_type:complete